MLEVPGCRKDFWQSSRRTRSRKRSIRSPSQPVYSSAAALLIAKFRSTDSSGVAQSVMGRSRLAPNSGTTVDHFDRSVVENQVELLTEVIDANRCFRPEILPRWTTTGPSSKTPQRIARHVSVVGCN